MIMEVSTILTNTYSYEKSKIFIKNFIKYFPPYVHLRVYYFNTPKILIFNDRVTHINLNEDIDFNITLDLYKDILSRPITKRINFNLLETLTKIYLITNTYEIKKKYTIFMDINLIIKKKITHNFLLNLVPENTLLSFFGRELLPMYSDTDFFIINNQNKLSKKFYELLKDTLKTRKLIKMKYWVFGFIFDYYRIFIENKEKIKNKNLTDQGLSSLKFNENKLDVINNSEIFNSSIIGMSKKINQNTANLVNHRIFAALFLVGLICKKKKIIEITDRYISSSNRLLNFSNYKNFNKNNIRFNNNETQNADILIINYENNNTFDENHIKIFNKTLPKDIIIIYRDKEYNLVNSLDIEKKKHFFFLNNILSNSFVKSNYNIVSLCYRNRFLVIQMQNI